MAYVTKNQINICRIVLCVYYFIVLDLVGTIY